MVWGVDGDVDDLKKVKNNETGWVTKVNAIFRKLFHSSVTRIGLAALTDASDIGEYPIGSIVEFAVDELPSN